jgi:hypothetical protein
MAPAKDATYSGMTPKMQVWETLPCGLLLLLLRVMMMMMMMMGQVVVL